jgi:hypothetical protein
MSAAAPKPNGTNVYEDSVNSKFRSSREFVSQQELLPSQGKKLQHLNSFLKEQINTAQTERRSNSIRSNNHIIEEAAKIKEKGGGKQEIVEYLRVATASGQGVSLF